MWFKKACIPTDRPALFILHISPWCGAAPGPRVRCDAVEPRRNPARAVHPVWRCGPRGHEFPAAPLQVDGGRLPRGARPTHGEESDLEQRVEASAQHQPEDPEEPRQPFAGPPSPPAGPQAGTGAGRKAEDGWTGGAGGTQVQDREQQRLHRLPQAPQPVYKDPDGAGTGHAQSCLTNI